MRLVIYLRWLRRACHRTACDEGRTCRHAEHSATRPEIHLDKLPCTSLRIHTDKRARALAKVQFGDGHARHVAQEEEAALRMCVVLAAMWDQWKEGATLVHPCMKEQKAKPTLAHPHAHAHSIHARWLSFVALLSHPRTCDSIG